MKNFHIIAECFLELSSVDRLKIIDFLLEKNRRLSEVAKFLNSTSQETHRNIHRLVKLGLVEKTVDGKYKITQNGSILHTMYSLPLFVNDNRVFFKEHSVNCLPKKFIKRLGALADSQRIDGVSKVLEKWKSMYENSTDYIFDMTSESLTEMDEVIMLKANNGVRYRHMIAKNHMESDDRASKLEKLGYYDALDENIIQRKILDSVGLIVIVNERESAVIFPDKNNLPDLRYMFYGQDKNFHDWCLDLYETFWKKGRLNSRKPIVLINKIIKTSY